MNCYKCGAEMRKKATKMTGEYAGETFAVSTEAMLCPSCGYTTLHASQLDVYRAGVADAYRTKQKLLTSKEIREIRSRLGMSQEDFSKYLGVGIASVKRWELGMPQDKSSDELIRIKSSLRRAEQNFADVLFSQGGEADEFSGGRPFSFPKLAAAVSFFLARGQEERKVVGTLHVNKLCWYADAENYRRHGISITGSRYAKLPYGPVLDDYRLIFRELERKGIIRTKGASRLEPVQAVGPSPLSEDEQEILNHVWSRFRNRLGRIVMDSHAESAWKKTADTHLISFRLVK